jgi:hypothetical protein
MTSSSIWVTLFAAGLSAWRIKAIAISSLRPLVKTTALATEGCRLVSGGRTDRGRGHGVRSRKPERSTSPLPTVAAAVPVGPIPARSFVGIPDDEAAPTKLPLQGMGEALRPHGIGLYFIPAANDGCSPCITVRAVKSVVIFRTRLIGSGQTLARTETAGSASALSKHLSLSAQ